LGNATEHGFSFVCYVVMVYFVTDAVVGFIHCFIRIQNGLTCRCQLNQVVLEKMLLNKYFCKM